jgi:hypothetical protein
MKTQYIVKAYEEELGDEYFLVTVPEGTDESKVYDNLEMAAKYARVNFDNEPEYYDEHFEDMVSYREECNGTETFNYYLEEYCGYTVTETRYDFNFQYEW